MSDNETEIMNELLQRFPKAVMTDAIQPLDEASFQAQKHKHISRNARGGSIGIISTPRNEIVLVKRSGMHAGWALPGGTVERGEDFVVAFEREIAEEIGIALHATTLVEIERKQFISPSDEKLHFLLAVFTAQMKECTLPPPTKDAKDEGLTVELFTSSRLPQNMILGDRKKAMQFAPK